MTHPTAAVDISRESAAALADYLATSLDVGDVSAAKSASRALIALRDAIDRAEAERNVWMLTAQLADARAHDEKARADRAEADKAAAVEAERAARTDKMRLALAAAVAGERERCAMIAKTFDTVLVDTSGGTWKIQPTFDAVAAAIREAPQ